MNRPRCSDLGGGRVAGARGRRAVAAPRTAPAADPARAEELIRAAVDREVLEIAHRAALAAAARVVPPSLVAFLG